MIPEKTQAVVLKMLAEGKHSQGQIAEIAKISKGAVALIATRGKILKLRGEHYLPKPRATGEPCETCGHIVPLPCIACNSPRRRHTGPADEDSTISLDLKDEAEKRRQGLLTKGLQCLRRMPKDSAQK